MHIPEGVIAEMLTPFDDIGRITEKETVKLVYFLIEKGVDGIFPVSSCAEYAHLDMEEKKYLIDCIDSTWISSLPDDEHGARILRHCREFEVKPSIIPSRARV
ncbi:MAG: dihydrodipicolinate synthase family protein, partial [Actinomycetota bacterium]